MSGRHGLEVDSITRGMRFWITDTGRCLLGDVLVTKGGGGSLMRGRRREWGTPRASFI